MRFEAALATIAVLTGGIAALGGTLLVQPWTLSGAWVGPAWGIGLAVAVGLAPLALGGWVVAILRRRGRQPMILRTVLGVCAAVNLVGCGGVVALSSGEQARARLPALGAWVQGLPVDAAQPGSETPVPTLGQAGGVPAADRERERQAVRDVVREAVRGELALLNKSSGNLGGWTEALTHRGAVHVAQRIQSELDACSAYEGCMVEVQPLLTRIEVTYGVPSPDPEAQAAALADLGRDYHADLLDAWRLVAVYAVVEENRTGVGTRDMAGRDRLVDRASGPIAQDAVLTPDGAERWLVRYRLGAVEAQGIVSKDDGVWRLEPPRAEVQP